MISSIEFGDNELSNCKKILFPKLILMKIIEWRFLHDEKEEKRLENDMSSSISILENFSETVVEFSFISLLKLSKNFWKKNFLLWIKNFFIFWGKCEIWISKNNLMKIFY